MGIYDVNDTGTKKLHSRYTKSISNRMRYNCGFNDLVPVLKRFCLPGDVWRIGGNALIRFLPMVSPSMTPYEFVVRFFFVPLRQVESNTELIITGSINGHLYQSTLPEFDNFVKNADKVTYPHAYEVSKYKFWDYMNVQIADYENIKNDKCLPAAYWLKAYDKIWFDYYRDENYDSVNDFDSLENDLRLKQGGYADLWKSHIKKDYFTSALPWQLKGVAPTLDVTGTTRFTPNFNFIDEYGQNLLIASEDELSSGSALHHTEDDSNGAPFRAIGGDPSTVDQYNQFAYDLARLLNIPQQTTITGLGFNADEFRVMMAQTRIFERLARCGSRYTEYLYSNFGTAPADETLQRPKYLGGWKIPIVTSEVLQTAEDGTTPVGTMRGHGISRGGNKVKDFYCKEFGLLYGIAEVRPKIEYTTGIPRQLTYKSRFDFFNPSFQHLSEQEVRNGELFINTTPDSDGKYGNDDTLGFQAYGNELRSSQDEVVADMRDSLSFWGSSLHFVTRPNVAGLLNAGNHQASFNAPFVANSAAAKNIIVDYANILDVYRPMVRFSTPGLVDHF